MYVIMPDVVSKGYNFVIIGYKFRILIIDDKFTKGVNYSMTRSRIKSIAVTILAIMLTMSSALSVSAAAKSPEYSASSAYRSSVYYKNLKNVKITGDHITDIVNVAKSQVGYHEGSLSGNTRGSSNVTEYGSWYGSQGAWCNRFVSWCAYVSGVPANIFPKITGSAAGYPILRSAGAECFSYSSSKALQPGDVIFVNSSGGYSGINHVGLVVGVDDTTIYTVEGNMSDEVKSITYQRSNGYSSRFHARITCVARPNYEDNSQKATDLSGATSVVSANGGVYALFDATVSFEEATELCKKMNGSLALIADKKELETVSSLASEGGFGKYYIGSGEDEISVITSDGKIRNASSKLSRTGFICEIDVEKVKPANVASFNGSKYEIYDASMTYEQASALAEAKGGSLAVVDDENTAMMLSFLLKKADSYYTGTCGSEKELKAVLNSFEKNTVFGDENVAVLLNDGSRKLSVKDNFDKTGKTGFIVEYSSEEKCTVIYDANKGENAPIEKIAEKGETIEVTHITPVNGKKEFLGWSLDKKAKDVDVKSGEALELKDNITLYAVWG